jgi:hypothetical protein
MNRETNAVRHHLVKLDAIRNEFKMFKESFGQFEAAFASLSSKPEFGLEEIKKFCSFRKFKKITSQPEAESYFFSDEVAEAARLVQAACAMQKLKVFKGDNVNELLVAHDVLMEQTSGTTENLCIRKRCPFVNECINVIVEAVKYELNQDRHYDLALDSQVMIEVLQRAEELVY